MLGRRGRLSPPPSHSNLRAGTNGSHITSFPCPHRTESPGVNRPAGEPPVPRGSYKYIITSYTLQTAHRHRTAFAAKVVSSQYEIQDEYILRDSGAVSGVGAVPGSGRPRKCMGCSDTAASQLDKWSPAPAAAPVGWVLIRAECGAHCVGGRQTAGGTTHV